VVDLLGRLLGGPSGGTQAFAATYSEGLGVGYRWFDQRGIEPLFPFGHGLSYTRFEYSDLAIKPDGEGLLASFRLRNAGSRKGSEVTQLYLGPAENAEIPMMPKSLAGFERVELEPGRSRIVSMRLARRSFSYWSPVRHDWVLATGSRKVYVGASSRDIRLEAATPAPLSSSR
jgi:beta-glucosidase